MDSQNIPSSTRTKSDDASSFQPGGRKNSSSSIHVPSSLPAAAAASLSSPHQQQVASSSTSGNNNTVSNNSFFGEALRHNIAVLQNQETFSAFDALNALAQSSGGGGALSAEASPLVSRGTKGHSSSTFNTNNNNNAHTSLHDLNRSASIQILADNIITNNNAADGELNLNSSFSGGGQNQAALLDITRSAVQSYGRLEPMELAMVQVEKQPTQTEEQQINAAELLAVISLLNEREFALLSEATHKQLKSGLESHLMYNGAAWYLPQVCDCTQDEPETGCDFSEGSLSVALCGKKIILPITAFFTRAVVLVVTWFVAWLALPSWLMSPGGYVFDPIVCFLFCAICGGILGRLTGVVPLVFVLGFAILWANVPEPQTLTKGIVKEVRTIVTRVGLTNILLRSGLSMSWNVMKPAAGTIVTMSILPVLAEIIVHGYTASSIMKYGDDKLWPFLQAVTCAASAPAVVAASCLLMRTWGYGITRGPGVILVPAVVLDMVLVSWSVFFIVSLVYRDESANLAWIIAQGPLQIFLGPIVGIIFGIIWFQILKFIFHEAKVLPHGKYAKAFLSRAAHMAAASFALLGLALIFFGYKYHCAGGGALACTFMAAAVNHMLTQPDAPEHFKIVKLKMYTYLTTLWDLLVMPALFSVGASSISVKTMFASDFVGRSLGCIFAGVAARIAVCFVCTWNYDMTISERVISVISTSGRAAVQVALGPLALQELANQPGGGTADQKKFATEVYDTAILGVLIFTPISAVLLTRVAPRFWLTDAEHARIAKEKEEKEPITATTTTENNNKTEQKADEAPSATATKPQNDSPGNNDDDDKEMDEKAKQVAVINKVKTIKKSMSKPALDQAATH